MQQTKAIHHFINKSSKTVIGIFIELWNFAKKCFNHGIITSQHLQKKFEIGKGSSWKFVFHGNTSLLANVGGTK